MGNLSRINSDNNKYKACSSQIDIKLFAFINNQIYSTQQKKELNEYLKLQKNDLLSNINEYNKRKSSILSSKPHQNKISTPNRFSTTKSRFSSKTKIRPKFKKTPLK